MNIDFYCDCSALLELDGTCSKCSVISNFIQWKGTDVCIDIHCPCGAHLHFDGWFLYAYQCFHCKKRFEMGSSVVITEVSETTRTTIVLKDE